MKRLQALAAGAALLILLARAAGATTVCAQSTADLRNALNAWQSASDQTYTIKLAQGTYAYPNMDYWSQPYYGGNAKLQLLGGYTSGCASRSLVASNTVIDGQHVTYSQFQIYGASSILVEGITFKGLDREVEVSGESSDGADSIVVRYVIGTDLFGAASVQESYGGFRVTGKSNMRVESSLFYNVHGGDTAAGLEVTGLSDNVIAVVTNVTSTYNGARGLQTGCFQCAGSVLVYNAILYNNTSGDIDTRYNSGSVTLAYSDHDAGKAIGAYSSIGNFANLDPKFENPLANDFLLLNNSPLLNVGAPENVVLGGYGSQDLDGGVRVVGSHIDLGAYESAVNDLVTQTVTSNLDNAFDPTLRTAITTANQNANATPIQFNITGACPQVITLATPLPDITTDVTIDGFTQSGAHANTQYLDYDGQICVIVRAANNAVDHALQVTGSGRLTVRGIEFEGFPTAAIRLAAGNGSVVTGNGFAAIPGATANDAGIRIEGTANNSLIGGLSPSSRNVFDQGTYGIDFAGNGTNRGNVVDGNWFGFNFDGSAWGGSKLQVGVYLSGSGGNTIGYNSIGNLNDYGIELTGANSTGNQIVANGIGVAPNNGAAGNGNAGIGIHTGAHGNVIGAPSGQSGGGNYIKNNLGPGVWVQTTAGNGNRIDGNNAIYDNAGLAIDLGAASDAFGGGPTANDAGDVDSGPNKLQNYPYLTEAKRLEARLIELDGYILPEALGTAQNYRLDVYWTDTCTFGSSGPDTPRGELKRYVGYFYVYADGSSTFIPFPFQQIDAPADIPKNGYLFAIATSAAGDTSEPGKCYPFTDDYIFTNGFN